PVAATTIAAGIAKNWLRTSWRRWTYGRWRALVLMATGNITDSEKVEPKPTTTALMCRKIENSRLVTASGIEAPFWSLGPGTYPPRDQAPLPARLAVDGKARDRRRRGGGPCNFACKSVGSVRPPP